MVKVIPVGKIIVDPSIQPRASLLNDVHVEDIRLAIRDNKIIPALVVFQMNDGNFLLAEGFHRLEAFKIEGKQTVACEVKIGSRDHAILWAMGSNQSHGLKRTNEDKRRAADEVMKLEPDWTDGKVAGHIGVTLEFVRRRRQQADDETTFSSQPLRTDTEATVKTKTGKDGKQYPQTRHKAPVAAPAAKPEAVIEQPEPEIVEAYDNQPEYIEPAAVPLPKNGSVIGFGYYNWEKWNELFRKLIQEVDNVGKATGTKPGERHDECIRLMRLVGDEAEFWREEVSPFKKGKP